MQRRREHERSSRRAAAATLARTVGGCTALHEPSRRDGQAKDILGRHLCPEPPGSSLGGTNSVHRQTAARAAPTSRSDRLPSRQPFCHPWASGTTHPGWQLLKRAAPDFGLIDAYGCMRLGHVLSRAKPGPADAGQASKYSRREK